MDTLSHEEKQLNELQLDIDEIQNLHDTSATRKNVKVLLAAWVEKLNYEKANIQKILDQ
jgi:calcyclin binding protein